MPCGAKIVDIEVIPLDWELQSLGNRYGWRLGQSRRDLRIRTRVPLIKLPITHKTGASTTPEFGEILRVLYFELDLHL